MQFWAENLDRIYPFVPNRDFLQNFIHAIFIYSLFVIMVESLEKILRVNCKIRSYPVLGWKLGLNLPISPKRALFVKFHSCHFFLRIICHYGAKFQKNPLSGLQDMKLRSFGPKNGTKFTHLSQKWIFSFMSFLPTHYLSLWCQVSKKYL